MAALVLGADRNGHLGSQLDALGSHPACSQRRTSGDDGEHDVVDGSAEDLIRLNRARSARTHSNRRCEPISTLSGTRAGLAKFHDLAERFGRLGDLADGGSRMLDDLLDRRSR